MPRISWRGGKPGLSWMKAKKFKKKIEKKNRANNQLLHWGGRHDAEKHKGEKTGTGNITAMEGKKRTREEGGGGGGRAEGAGGGGGGGPNQLSEHHVYDKSGAWEIRPRKTTELRGEGQGYSVVSQRTTS